MASVIVRKVGDACPACGRRNTVIVSIDPDVLHYSCAPGPDSPPGISGSVHASFREWKLLSHAGAQATPKSDEQAGWVSAYTRPTDSKIAAAAKKVPLNMVPLSGLKGMARVFAYGTKKHGRGNFATGTDDGAPDRYIGGFLRHVADSQKVNGVYDWESLAKLDEESGLPEIDHALCGLLMLRIIMTIKGTLPADPGEGKEPPNATTQGH